MNENLSLLLLIHWRVSSGEIRIKMTTKKGTSQITVLIICCNYYVVYNYNIIY